MGKSYEYGILCTSKDEKKLIDNLNLFLAPLNRTFAKNKNKFVLEARLPYVYKHIYFNSNKTMQVYIEVYPNTDLSAKRKFDTDAAWIIFANLIDRKEPFHVAIEEQEKYLHDLLDAIKFEIVQLYEYKKDEERL